MTSDGAALLLGAPIRRSGGGIIESSSDDGHGEDRREVSAVAPNNVQTDEHLLARVGCGSKEALGLLFRRYRRVLLNVAGRILRDASEAEDLCQDVFLYLFEKAEFFDASKGTASSWIIQMVAS